MAPVIRARMPISIGHRPLMDIPIRVTICPIKCQRNCPVPEGGVSLSNKDKR
jgi:hypothetical protein